MVLGEALTDGECRRHAMVGLLPLATSFAERRLHLGYRCATLLRETPLGAARSCFRGHEFHYATTVIEEDGDPLWAATDAAGADLGCYGLRRGSVFGSFIHLIDAAGPATTCTAICAVFRLRMIWSSLRIRSKISTLAIEVA